MGSTCPLALITQFPANNTIKVVRRQTATPRYAATLDLRESFVTTAAADETVSTELGGLEGALFRFDVRVEGLAKETLKMAS